MPTLTCPAGHQNDSSRFITLTVVRKTERGKTESVKARICPEKNCGSIFVEEAELRRLWPGHLPEASS
jgi:hypothetical protein